MAIQIIRRPVARRPVAQQAGIGTDVRKMLLASKNAQAWTYYDTRYFGATAFPTDPGTFNFAQCEGRTSFFNSRTTGNAGWPFTSNSDQNKLDRDFLCYAISIEVDCDPDAPGPAGGGAATGSQFGREWISNSAFVITFGSDPIFVAPTADLPGGGAPFYGPRVRTQAAAANSDAGSCVNGIPDNRAKRYLRAPISFKQGASFAIYLELTPTALASIQGLTPLTGNLTAMVRVCMEGVRGKPLLEGVSANPDGSAAYNHTLR